MNMQFMCKKHRSELEEDPKSGVVIWLRLINLARYQTSCFQWDNAIKSYGNALEAAEVIFMDDPTSTAVNRYLRTAIEFIYTIRQCDHRCDMQFVTATIKNKLQAGLHPANVDLLLKPVTDIADAPMREVRRWMQALFVADQKQAQQYS